MIKPIKFSVSFDVCVLDENEAQARQYLVENWFPAIDQDPDIRVVHCPMNPNAPVLGRVSEYVKQQQKDN